jgi:hypothetical protein
MSFADKIRAAITRRLETDDDRALKDEQWEADMRADGWTKVADQGEQWRNEAEALGDEAYAVELPGGRAYTTHDPDWAQLWREQDEALKVERDRQSTRHTTVEVTREESDALWESVDELDRAKRADSPRTWEDGNRGNGWSWHAQGGWRHDPSRDARPKGKTRATVDTGPDDNYDGNTSGHGFAL